jgi:ATP-binding cassette subfamily B protein
MIPKYYQQRSKRQSRAQTLLLSPRTQLNQLRYLPQALGLVWKAAPQWTIATLILLVIQGLLPVFTVFLTRELVDNLVAVVQSNGDAALLRPAITTALLMGLVLVTGEAMSSVSGYVRTALAEQVQDRMSALIHKQSIALDLQFYESPSYYDQLHRASIDALDRPLALLENLGALLQNTITLLAMAGVLITFAWWMPIVLLVGTLPALWVALRTAWRFNRWRVSRTVEQRRLQYYHRVLATDYAAAELRLFQLGEHFSRAYSDLRRKLRSERLQLSRDQTLAQLLASLIGLSSIALALGWLFWQALQGRFSLGDLAMFYQAMNQGQRLMRTLLNSVSDIYRNLLFLEDLFTFLELRPQIADPPSPVEMPDRLKDAVRLEEITFGYPDSPRIALDAFNLTIPAGKVVAIVGENGAGKSTLLKLLNRFYDPNAGSITWDGIDLRQVRLADLRRRITVLFQQPVPYHETVADNIALGDLSAGLSRAQIENAAQQAGADTIVGKLPEGYDTLLSKWFGQTDLSVGEWQRVALARAFVRQADLIILDEPTSAMDSWAEIAWMGRFRDLVDGRTALIITHRFTTAMQADIIHVMAAGRIIESGTHAELLAMGGQYALSWRAQMREVGTTPVDVNPMMS